MSNDKSYEWMAGVSKFVTDKFLYRDIQPVKLLKLVKPKELLIEDLNKHKQKVSTFDGLVDILGNEEYYLLDANKDTSLVRMIEHTPKEKRNFNIIGDKQYSKIYSIVTETHGQYGYFNIIYKKVNDLVSYVAKLQLVGRKVEFDKYEHIAYTFEPGTNPIAENVSGKGEDKYDNVYNNIYVLFDRPTYPVNPTSAGRISASMLCTAALTDWRDLRLNLLSDFYGLCQFYENGKIIVDALPNSVNNLITEYLKFDTVYIRHAYDKNSPIIIKSPFD